MKREGVSFKTSTLLLGVIADKLANLVWMFSEDGAKRQNPPESFTQILLGHKKQKESPIVCYDTPEQWHEAMRKYQ